MSPLPPRLRRSRRSRGARCLAFGYAAYQSDWPEQTPLAVARLRATLAEYGIELKLPVAELASRQETQAALRAFGLSPTSLEQKCSKQVSNVALTEDRLRAQVSLWESAIRRSLDEADKIPTAIIEDTMLCELVEASK